ncbi:type I polyketide synthase [Chitinimonas lacunae]|uniref:Type I polyketide synthase n=1 Tax=Chitinimonas lacunae TaxID=1963018 RepID=A0ABV8MPC2_9NEIS
MDNRTYTGLEIAVVGMACRVPGADDVEGFWQLLREGREGLREADDAELLAHGIKPEQLADPAFVRRGGTLRDSDCFDAEFFRMSPHEAQITDPQHRVFLELAWTALDDAALGPAARGGSCGVYAGAGANLYLWKYLLEAVRQGQIGATELAIANSNDYLASRVAYKLDLRGPALNVQSACSTSLVAIHYACQALIGGECEIALAGGVRINQPQVPGYRYQPGGIGSPDGHCRAFDAEAGGTVGGSGAGVVVLKRLEDALAAGDRIRAVILGSAVNNDGADKVGFTAPSVVGQAAVIRAALAMGEVAPDSIGYVEAHGTGTPLGDPIEIAALRDAFGPLPPASCLIGSVKTNIGHLDAAAGVVGLIKTVLLLERGEIPPSLHFKTANPALELERSPFEVNAHLRPWPKGGLRRAGVSSFGIGGTNAHVVLEQAPLLTPATADTGPHTFVLSARTPADLSRSAGELADHLSRFSALSPADVAYTTQLGLIALPQRLAVVADDLAQAIERLGQADSAITALDAPRVAWLFPGQGAEYAGMAARLYQGDAGFRQHLDNCLTLFSPLLGFDLSARLFGTEGVDGDTLLAQAMLFSVEYALAQRLRDFGVRPVALLGHSLGEISAACVAGVFELDEAVRLIVARGRAMAQSQPGRMLAVQAPVAELLGLLTDTQLAVAADNSPGQTVVAGPQAAVEAFAAVLDAQGYLYKPLPSRHAFHSALMTEAADSLARCVATLTLRPPTIPFISNVSGDWITAAQATDPDYWGRQLCSTVQFRTGCRTLEAAAVDLLVEVGPGDTLRRLTAQQGPALGQLPQLATLPRRSEQDVSDRLFHEALAGLWCHGVTLDWSARHGTGSRHRVGLPSYPFARKRFWIGDESAPTPEPTATTSSTPLPRPAARRHARPDLAVAYTAPGNELESVFAELFGSLLKIEQVGIHDSFFDLGGDSLLGIRLVELIRHRLDVSLSVAAIYEYPTVAALVEQVELLILAQLETSFEA